MAAQSAQKRKQDESSSDDMDAKRRKEQDMPLEHRYLQGKKNNEINLTT